MRKMIIIGCMIAVSTVHGGVISSGDSAPMTLDLRTGARESTGDEALTYSSLWDGGEGATVTIAQDGVVIAEGLTGEGERTWSWSVQKAGTHVLTHTTYTNGVAGKVETATFRLTKDISSLTVDDIAGVTYTGSAFTPNPVVAVGTCGYMLVKDTDYTLSYANNVNAGTATVTVTGNGNFTGSATKQFTISPKAIASAMVGGVANVTYTGSAHRPEPTVTDSARGVALVKGADYTLSWGANTVAGSGSVTVTGKGNYTGAVTRNFTIAKQTVPFPAIASKPYSGGQQIADLSTVALYDVAQNAGGVEVGQYDVKLRLVDSSNYTWPGVTGADTTLKFSITKASNSWVTQPSIAGWTYGQAANAPNMGAAKFGTAGVTYSATPQNAGSYTATFTVPGTANYEGLTKQVPFTIAKATYDMSWARWDYAGAFLYDGDVKTVVVSGLPLGVTVHGYSGNTGMLPGLYTAHATLAYDSVNYNEPIVADLAWEIKSESQAKIETTFADLPVAVEPDGAGGWKVTLTNDIDSADLPIEIQDNLGKIAIDLNGHDLIGADGADGDGSTPGGDGRSAIRIVPGAGGGEATELSVVSSGGGSLVKGGDGGAGNPGGDGAAAIEVSESAKGGVRIVIGGGVTVQGGAGGGAVGEGAEPGNDAPAVEGGEAVVSGGTLVKVSVAPPSIAAVRYTGLLQTAAVPSSPLYDIVQNAGGVNAGQYNVKLRLADPKGYTWPDAEGADRIVKFTIVKATNAWIAEPSMAGWIVGQGASVPNMGAARFGTASVTYGASGTACPADAGSYTATFTVPGTANYGGLVKSVPFEVKSAEEAKLDDIFGDLPVVIEPDGDGGWKVTLTNDLDLSDGPLEVPDNLGNVTIDLGGHDLIGADGVDGDPRGDRPGGDGQPAIRIVPGAGGGDATELSVVSTGGDALVQGGDGGAGNPGGNGAPAIEVAAGAQGGVKVNVGEGVTVQGGDGGASDTGRGGDGGAGIDGNVGVNDGTITGGSGGASVSGDGGNGGPGVDGNVDVNNGSIDGGSGGFSEQGHGGNGGQGVTGSVGTNNGTIAGGAAGGTTSGTPGDDVPAVGGTIGGGTGTVRKMKVQVPEIQSVEYTGEALEPQVPESTLYAVSASGGIRPGSYPVMFTLLDTVNYEWIPREGATINGALAVVNFVIFDPPPRIEASAEDVVATYDGEGHGISVSVAYPPSGWTVRYATSAEGPFAAEPPLFTNAVSSAATWYEVRAEGLEPVTNVARVTVAPRSLAKAALGSLRFESRGGVRTPVPTLVDDLGREVPASALDFTWREEANGAMTLSFTGRGNYLGLFETRLAQTRFRVEFDANGGEVDRDGADYDIGTYYGVLPIPSRAGYLFGGWYERANLAGDPVTRNTQVIAQDLTLHAKWLRRALWYSDAKFHLEAAATYDGYAIDPASGDAVAGSVSVKVGKPNKNTGMCKVYATVQIAGEKPQKFKGTTYDGTFAGESKDGRTLSLKLGADSLSGSFGRFSLDGSRNLFKSKDEDSKLRSAQAMKRWQGTYVVAWQSCGAAGAEGGWNGLSIEVKAKGKAKVSGVLADGAKVSAKSQLLVGERECALAVSWTKKGSSVACLVWFCEDGTVECANLPGGASALIANSRDGAYLGAGAAFRIDAVSVSGMAKAVAGLLPDLLPCGQDVRMNGAQFELDKPGKVAMLKDKSGVDMSKAGANPSGLKLKYKIKNCTFKGSFMAYAIDGGKLRKVKVQVSGVVLGGKGYGTAMIKKVGSWAISIE